MASVLAIVFAVFYMPQLFAQESTPPNWRDFFGPSSVYESLETEALPEAGAVPETKFKTPSEVQAETTPQGEVEIELRDFSVQEKSVVESVPLPSIPYKKMVEVPTPEEKRFIDAGDFHDPFFLLRGTGKDVKTVLEPGVTVDGVQFNSYKDSDLFVEKVYQDSRFRLEDVFGEVEHLDGGVGSCIRCHRGIERISEHHKFRCTKCHEGNRRKRTLPAAHRNLVANPSDLDHAPKYCGKCHADQIEQVERSTMATGRGMIDVTRYAWGAQVEGVNVYSLRPHDGAGGGALLPGQDDGETVDVFLRTKCLRCHLQSQAPHRPGDYRAGGCAACHMVYANDGVTLTHDRAIQSRQRKDLQK
ncbi:MAG: hypothetical protein QGH15_22430, partial [Kiritimatiellia bacterium]|nr:hypothetical protein [Kiritimatiellia bacterium]